MPVKPLPARPNLDHLKHQATDLLKQHAARDRAAAQRLREFHPRFHDASDGEIFAAKLNLASAQLTIAREHGFPTWPRLKAHVASPPPTGPHHERIGNPLFRRAVDLLDVGDTAALRAHLAAHPSLIRQHVTFEGANYFREPTLLEFIAENPIRHGTLPPNIVEIARTLLDADPTPESRNEALMLVASGSVSRTCGVQVALINLLCDHGADPGRAAQVAAVLSEPASVKALIARGARITLPIAAALDRIDAFRTLLPAAGKQERHLALAIASNAGHIEIVRLLLDAGEDPNRYNPVGGHSHATPLHQAALSGNRDLVDLLLAHAANPDTKDVMWQGTPADWAQHNGHTQLEAHLRALET